MGSPKLTDRRFLANTNLTGGTVTPMIGCAKASSPIPVSPPASWHLFGALPRTSTGKIQKFVLREHRPVTVQERS